MKNFSKTVWWLNISIFIYLSLAYISAKVGGIVILQGIVSFIWELFIFPIAGIVVASFVYAICLLIKKKAVVHLLLTAFINGVILFVLPK